VTLRPRISASSTSSRSIRRGEFHPLGRSRTALESAKLELRLIIEDSQTRPPIRDEVGEVEPAATRPAILL